MPMKCLFVRHPYAGWIVDGVKPVEYRTMQTKIRGRIGIIQSRSGLVIGDVEITGCKYNEELDYYEWELANAHRYATPVPFTWKSGAVVWINVEYDPEVQEIAPKLSGKAFKREQAAYEADLDRFLHPKLIWTAVMKDGREIQFDDDAEFDAFEAKHRKEIKEFYSEEVD